jgi:hypothetical protein
MGVVLSGNPRKSATGQDPERRSIYRAPDRREIFRPGRECECQNLRVRTQDMCIHLGRSGYRTGESIGIEWMAVAMHEEGVLETPFPQ